MRSAPFIRLLSRLLSPKIAMIWFSGALLSACTTVDGVAPVALSQSHAMVMGATAPAPSGFVEFCTRHPGDCGLAAEASAVSAAGAPQQPDGQAHMQRIAAVAGAPVAEPTSALVRKELYSKYMWQAAFNKAHDDTVKAQGGAPPRRIAQRAAWDKATGAIGPTARGHGDQPKFKPSEMVSLVTASPATAAQETDDAAATPPAPFQISLSTLKSIDSKINRSIIQTDDEVLYGQADYWAVPLEDGSPSFVVRGDCEDYALEKRRVLLAMGVPADALALAVAETRWGTHAVLLLNTPDGELVLDNLTTEIRSWQKTGYNWVKRQEWGQPMMWNYIGPAA